MSFKSSEGAQWSEPQASGAAAPVFTAGVLIVDGALYYTSVAADGTGTALLDTDGALWVYDTKLAPSDELTIRLRSGGAVLIGAGVLALAGAETFSRASTASYTENAPNAVAGAETFSRSTTATYTEDA